MPASEVNIIVYTPTVLQAWNVELQANKQQVNERTAEIVVQEQRLTTLQNSLGQKDRDIRWSQTQLEMMRMQDMMYARKSFRHPSYYYDPYEAHLISELDRLYTERRQIVMDMESYKTAKTIAQSQRKKLEGRGTWLTTHILAAESFLETLQNNPSRLVYELKDKLLNAIDDYEEKHFIGLSPQVRISLWQIRQGFERLVIDTPDVREQQINYLRLCGFLGYIETQVRQENKEEHFLNCLVTVINSTHVRSQDDLPEQLKTENNARAWFEAVQNQYPLIFANSEHDILNTERSIFQQAMTFLLHANLSQQTEMQRKIIQAAQTLQVEIEGKAQRNEAIDFHFYTRIATNLINVYNNPGDMHAAKRLGDMADYATGAASLSKKVLGSLLVVVGTLLIGVSTAAFVTSLGSSALLSAWGLAIGLSLLQMQIAGGIAFSLTTATGAGLTFWGSSKINAGMRQGFSQELNEVQEIVQAAITL